MAREDARGALYLARVDDPHGRLSAERANAVMAARTAEHALRAIDELTTASTQLANGEYDPATQRRVHAAFAAYERSAEFCNPRRIHPDDALAAHLNTPQAQRGAMWRAVDAQRTFN